MAHEIRLAGPWEFSTDAGQTWQRCTLPLTVDQPGLSQTSQLQLQRKFHCPSNLQETSQVFLRFEADSSQTEMSINDHAVAEIQQTKVPRAFDVDVTSHLLSFNSLVFQATLPWTESLKNVRLRIEE